MSRGRRGKGSDSMGRLLYARLYLERIEPGRSGVLLNRFIARNQPPAFDNRLRDQDSIERVAMVVRKVLQPQRVRESHRDLLESVGPHAFEQVGEIDIDPP